MDSNTLALIGVVDTLQYVLESEKATAKRKDLKASSKALEVTRQQLLQEGLRYNKLIGAARDSVLGIARQLRGYLVEQPGMEWVLSGIQTASLQDVEPPDPPSSSATGPKDISPEFLKLAHGLMRLATERVEPESSTDAGFKSPTTRANVPAAKNSKAKRR